MLNDDIKSYGDSAYVEKIYLGKGFNQQHKW